MTFSAKSPGQTRPTLADFCRLLSGNSPHSCWPWTLVSAAHLQTSVCLGISHPRSYHATSSSQQGMGGIAWAREPPTSEPSLNPLRMCWNRAKKIHLISEKLILAVAKERFERTIACAARAPAMKDEGRAGCGWKWLAQAIHGAEWSGDTRC